MAKLPKITPDENNQVVIYGHKIDVHPNSKTITAFGTEYEVKRDTKKEEAKTEDSTEE